LVAAPTLHTADLPSGPLTIRDSGPPDGRPDAPVVVLIHGWSVSADLNWCRSYAALTGRFRVLAWDQRGHGPHGRRTRRFRLEDCADDVAEVCRTLDIDRVVVAGYSMGGSIAQLVARRHPAMVQGLVLCATAARFAETRDEHRDFRRMGRLAPVAALLPGAVWRLVERIAVSRGDRLGIGDPDFDAWARAEVQAGRLHSILAAGAALGGFDSRRWVGGLGVPTAVVVCTSDTVVATDRQRRLAASVAPSATIEISCDHAGCVTHPERFAPALVDAIDRVTAP
jgi:3-oxoadipate enol-lactonase